MNALQPNTRLHGELDRRHQKAFRTGRRGVRALIVARVAIPRWLTRARMESSASVKRQKTTQPPAAAAHLYVHGTVKLGADGQSRWRVDGSTKNTPFVWEPVAAATETSPGHAQAARAAARAAARTAALGVTADHDELAPPPPPAEPARAPVQPAGRHGRTPAPLQPLSKTRERRLSSVPTASSHAKPPPRKPLPGSLAGVAAAAAAAATTAAAAAGTMPRSPSTPSMRAAACVSRSSSLGVICAAPWLCAVARSQLRCARISGSYAVRKVCVSAFTLSSSWCEAPPSPSGSDASSRIARSTDSPVE